ncbi:MAG: UDP-N-acetylglucosamine 1-carboxyvinyltransferase [Sphaerochaetaceae bacterium]
MSSYVITGGFELEGTVHISGNKNAALCCLAATLLTDEKVILHNIPAIEDVHVMVDLLRMLGSQVDWVASNSVQITSSLTYDLHHTPLDPVLVDLIRASILLAGPLVGRFHTVILPPPGGDVIGLRRLDTHFHAFEALGAECKIDKGGIISITTDKLMGSKVFLDEASVTATENTIMAAVVAEGRTRIQNAASEPHVQDLCNLLVKMGASIGGIGSNLLEIEGTKKLHGAEFTIGFDYMEAGSFLGLVGATGGEVELVGINHDQLPMIEKGFDRLGLKWHISGEQGIVLPRTQSRIIKKSVGGQTLTLDDAPWPGFPADLLSILIVVATQMSGSILIHEKMYESRMFFIDWLIRMGADIILCDPHRALIQGPSSLKPAEVTSPDIRAGMALVIAALCAEGESTLHQIYQIERGYEELPKKLTNLGAKITSKA